MCNLQLKWLSDVITVLLRVVKKKNESIVLKYGTWTLFLFEDMIFLKSVFIDMWWFYMFEFPSDGKIIYRCPMSPVLSCTHKQVCILIYVHSRPNTFEVLFSKMKISLLWPFSFVGNFSHLRILFPPSSLRSVYLLTPYTPPPPTPHPFFPSYLHSPSTPFPFSWIKCSFTPCALNCISFV